MDVAIQSPQEDQAYYLLKVSIDYFPSDVLRGDTINRAEVAVELVRS